ncbi:hypothetical protein UK23_39805 [Lentzea aerocolonigenes]|uniref:Uncharacterized protein n=1 Tax=Lentzea aerocolonigenes TaxID=68170 RepID=A0A0F0GEU6_LENAE|nr:hypothetical protein [Lentzea aerocolonigenes]KJK41905.1 hypothetical protein UK23_39805 [Lentzea aerocolonigenes]
MRIAVLALLLAGCTAAVDPAPRVDLEHRVVEFAEGLSPSAPYRAPDSVERDTALRALMPLLDGTATEADGLRPLGFTVDSGVDGASGRQFVLATTKPGAEQGWGMYIADRSTTPRLVIEVPHPNADLDTEALGIELYRRTPGAVVLIAGAHRRAAGEQADVAHHTDALFHAVATDLAGRGLPQVQLHGFAEQSLPGSDVVVSTGQGRPGPAARRVADRVGAAGLATCRGWDDECGNLEGTRNVQGKAAAEHGFVFLHIEVTGRLRESVASRAELAQALAEADVSAG